jgi:hypothetical protein
MWTDYRYTSKMHAHLSTVALFKIPDWWVHMYSVITFYSIKVLGLAFTSKTSSDYSWKLNFMYFLTVTFPLFYSFSKIILSFYNKHGTVQLCVQIRDSVFSEIMTFKNLVFYNQCSISIKLGTKYYYKEHTTAFIRRYDCYILQF